MEQSTEYTITRLTSQYIGMEQLCELVNVLSSHSLPKHTLILVLINPCAMIN